MAKFPSPGKVKTRLARSIGNDRACKVYRRLLERTVANTTSNAKEYSLGVFVEPRASLREFSKEFAGLDFYYPQVGLNLGDRMYHAFETLLSVTGVDAAILIGADIPGLSQSLILDAFDHLLENDIVWGPSSDGGYYLIGLRQLCTEPFTGIDWSTPQVLTRSIAKARSAGLNYQLLKTELDDIDTIDDLRLFPEFGEFAQ